MPRIYINIGSNKGDRAALIERAVAAVSARIDPAGRAVIRLSPVVESAPWGYESASPYLNVGMMAEMPGDACPDPHSLLDMLLDAEHSIDPSPHRDAAGRYTDRCIDIDLIAVDDLVIDTAHLTLPHPRMHLRHFVLAPMAHLDSAWRHPLLGLTAGEMLADEAGV